MSSVCELGQTCLIDIMNISSLDFYPENTQAFRKVFLEARKSLTPLKLNAVVRRRRRNRRLVNDPLLYVTCHMSQSLKASIIDSSW